MTVDPEKHAHKAVSGLSTAPDARTGSLHTGTIDDAHIVEQLGYRPELIRNRSMFTLLFQSLAIAAIPYGEGAPIISAAVYGGGPLSIFVGWILVLVLDECVALSLAELASKYPTSAGPYYWSFQLATRGKTVLSFITGWTWLVGNWTITLSVNFGYVPTRVRSISTRVQVTNRDPPSDSPPSYVVPWPCTIQNGKPPHGKSF
jgi:amino acid transporter